MISQHCQCSIYSHLLVEHQLAVQVLAVGGLQAWIGQLLRCDEVGRSVAANGRRHIGRLRLQRWHHRAAAVAARAVARIVVAAVRVGGRAGIGRTVVDRRPTDGGFACLSVVSPSKEQRDTVGFT